MSDISLQRYVTASAGGMLPCQSLHAYIGSTLRSMEEVVSSSSSSNAAYIVFGGQVCDHALRTVSRNKSTNDSSQMACMSHRSLETAAT